MVLGGTGKQRHGQMLNTWCLRGLEYPLSSWLGLQGGEFIYSTYFLWFFYAGPFCTATHFRIHMSWGEVMTQFRQHSPQKRMSHTPGAESCTASEPSANSELHGSAPDMRRAAWQQNEGHFRSPAFWYKHQVLSSAYNYFSCDHSRSTRVLNQF